jgi:hypothetical protein
VQLVSVRNDEREEDGTLYTPSTPQKESWGNSYNRLLDNYDMALRRTLPKCKLSSLPMMAGSKEKKVGLQNKPRLTDPCCAAIVTAAARLTGNPR